VAGGYAGLGAELVVQLVVAPLAFRSAVSSIALPVSRSKKWKRAG
jgi:hypothetical protein